MYQLVIGNKNYSTWSLRPWLLLKAHQVSFEEKQVSLEQEELSEALSEFSGSAKVPVLFDGTRCVWDSLAICEYINDNIINGKGWPEDSTAKAFARCATAEMHSSFQHLRNEAPMNIRAKRRLALSTGAQKDLSRIDELWQEGRAQFHTEGEFLCGPYSIADCFYTPVAYRIKTYGFKLSSVSQTYCEALLAHPAAQAWACDALLETEIVEQDEAGEEV
ncbi:glutathione S-transferase family protein [Marinibactrum halimedae]|uniref:Glutathione S-transferase n=1 Tax=Marinibactrum halimedae TaxID=1444977 RepID=A0AA37T0W9_9GAMM|nr:glutathione S-transferase family protein [Marinibactrum halimedae]MCD9457772.1 glutathione S-transferase family protein [Marinibactrum halimedae]GLS24854.1 glutathione S-transferase [Marinibactrum halimedae]